MDGCNTYFQRRPYGWFGPLETVLRECGASYYDGAACHLDLVQWATEEKWSKIWSGVRKRLLRADVPFLIEQLEHSDIRVLLLNGKTVVEEFSTATETVLVLQSKKIMGKTRIFVGRGPRNILIVGWSTNLQTSYGVTNEWRTEIAKAVAAIVMDTETGKNSSG